ncbi:hypothetical protein Q8A73_021638 [Channa argus]|nr:hypothetical protein Q8A73_021638 [Channa argus]
MPFGLTNAPAVFQSLINSVLRDFINRFVFVYLDDILIFSRNLHDHRQHVRLVLQRLLENRLFVKAEKCEFHVSTVSFLGFLIGEGEVKPDPEKTRAVTEWPRPGTRKQLQRFLGFANFYRRFIKNYSTIAAPLTKLTSPIAPFRWTEKAEGAFTQLKDQFTSPPILSQPDTSRQFVVEVDASEVGVDAVLSQRSEGDQKLRPCAFFSRQLSSAERNYSVGDRELLAIKLALEEWRHWLEGVPQPFIIWTDHKNLAHLRTAKRLNSRQARWSLFFDRFNFSLTYRPGSKNIKPDALSHIHAPETSPHDPEPILHPSCVLGALTWEIERTVRTAQQQEPDPGTGPPGLLFVPSRVCSQVLQWAHCSKFSCHPGADRSIHLLRRHFWWLSLIKDTREFVAACATCARGKTPKKPPDGLLQPLPIPSRPWSHIALDFVTGLPPSYGNTTILTIIDRFSKAVHFVPLPKLPTATETAELITQHVLRLHGIPRDIVSDRGPQFVSQVWKAFCKALGATVSLSSGFHPQSNGQTERANQSLETALRCVTSSNPATWSSFIPWIEYAHNSLTSSATGLSPFMCSLGYQPPMFPNQETEIAVPSVNAHIRRCRRLWKEAQAALLRTTQRNKRLADRRRIPAPTYTPANLIFVSLPSDPPAALLCSATPSAPRLHGSFSRGHHSSSTCDSPSNRYPPHKASSSSDQPLRSPDIASRQRSPFPPTQSTVPSPK